MRTSLARSLALTVLLVAAACGDNVHHERGELLVYPRTGLFTDESGATAQFMLALTEAPLEDRVVVTLSSNAESEGTVSPRTVIFDLDNFSSPLAVTVRGNDDRVVDGEQPYVVRVGTDLLGSFEVALTNGDNDEIGVRVAPISGLVTSEAGGEAMFTVELLSQPASDVTISVASSDLTEGKVDRSQLTFTKASFGPQTVTVTGVQDTSNDDTVQYTIALGKTISADATYNGLDVDDVQIANTDDDTATSGIQVTPTSGLTVSETETTATFTVVLLAAPTGNVTFPVTSSDTTEATVSTSSIQFTPGNWNTPQTVTVTGVDDQVDDDNQGWMIVLGVAASTDLKYSGVNPSDVVGTTTDNDTAGITVNPTATVTTTESAGTDAFTVRLDSQPTSPVTIGISSSDTGEGTVSTASLVFDAVSWSTPQTVTVTGVDDAVTDGAQNYSIVLAAATSSDTKYSGLNAADLAASNADNDLAGFTFDQTSVVVSEFKDTDTFTLSLNTAPTANVVIAVSSNDTTEGTVVPTTITFTPQNWDVPQTISVTGVNDMTMDGNITFAIVLGAATSTDPAYSGLDPTDVQAINLDDESAQVYVKSKSVLAVSESGPSTTFRMQLTIAPTANVTCTLTSSDATEGAVSPMSLTFMPNSFGFQTVTVTGVDDNLVDNDQSFTIITNACTSTDPAYSGVNPRDVSAINRDND